MIDAAHKKQICRRIVDFVGATEERTLSLQEYFRHKENFSKRLVIGERL